MIKKLLMGLFATTATTPAISQDVWEIYTAEDNGMPLVVRLRSDIPSTVTPSAYPHMIAITWQYKSESGMPSALEKESMDDLEDTITSVVEPKNQGFLTVVVTGNETREWQFYARNTQDFMSLLNGALANKPVFPIELSLQSDPEWEAYKQFSSNGT
jgi:hypothetical protein